MRHRIWSPVLFVCAISTLAYASYTLSSKTTEAANSARSQGEVIPQPADWVAFSADLEVTHADRDLRVVGRFFRDTHGCGRMETGRDGNVELIYIKNIPRSEYYSWSKKTDEWVAGRMKLPSDGWRPIQRPIGAAGYQKRALFAEIRKGRPYSLRASEGFAAYTLVNGSGTFSLQIPELNFFDVLTHSLEGRREAYSNLVLENQPQNLFEPPQGIAVLSTDKVGGIVSESAHGAMSDHAKEIMQTPIR